MTSRLATALLGFVLTTLALASAPVAAMEPQGPQATITGGGRLAYIDLGYVGAEFGVAAVVWPSGITVGQFSIVIEFTDGRTLALYGVVDHGAVDADQAHFEGMGVVRETLTKVVDISQPAFHVNVPFHVLVTTGETPMVMLMLHAPVLDGKLGDVGGFDDSIWTSAVGDVIEGRIVIDLRKVL